MRWTICALLFCSTTICYIDRQVLSILAPDLQQLLGWSEVDYGHIVTAFQGAYAIGLLLVGRLMDALGTRRGMALAMAFWSLASMAHAAASSAAGFAAARFGLGLGEAGNFPAAIKTVAEWFPRRERAFATGIFNAGANIGAIVAPLTVPWIALHWGWRSAFIATGVIGFAWLAAWLALYQRPEEHAGLSAAELAYIRSDQEEAGSSPGWLALLGYRATWAFALGKLITDPVWWFLLFWLPKFFNTTYGLKLDKVGPPLVAIYLTADVGSVAGGWLSSALIGRGWSVNAGRKTAMLACALCVVPIAFAAGVSSVWLATALIGLACAAHQGWSCNLFTLVSDLFPRPAVASVVGLGGMFGSASAMVAASAVGWLLARVGGNYHVPFVLASGMYLLALGVIHALVPRLAATGTEAVAAPR